MQWYEFNDFIRIPRTIQIQQCYIYFIIYRYNNKCIKIYPQTLISRFIRHCFNKFLPLILHLVRSVRVLRNVLTSPSIKRTFLPNNCIRLAQRFVAFVTRIQSRLSTPVRARMIEDLSFTCNLNGCLFSKSPGTQLVQYWWIDRGPPIFLGDVSRGRLCERNTFRSHRRANHSANGSVASLDIKGWNIHFADERATILKGLPFTCVKLQQNKMQSKIMTIHQAWWERRGQRERGGRGGHNFLNWNSQTHSTAPIAYSNASCTRLLRPAAFWFAANDAWFSSARYSSCAIQSKSKHSYRLAISNGEKENLLRQHIKRQTCFLPTKPPCSPSLTVHPVIVSQLEIIITANYKAIVAKILSMLPWRRNAARRNLRRRSGNYCSA